MTDFYCPYSGTCSECQGNNLQPVFGTPQSSNVFKTHYRDKASGGHHVSNLQPKQTTPPGALAACSSRMQQSTHCYGCLPESTKDCDRLSMHGPLQPSVTRPYKHHNSIQRFSSSRRTVKTHTMTSTPLARKQPSICTSSSTDLTHIPTSTSITRLPMKRASSGMHEGCNITCSYTGHNSAYSVTC